MRIDQSVVIRIEPFSGDRLQPTRLDPEGNDRLVFDLVSDVLRKPPACGGDDLPDQIIDMVEDVELGRIAALGAVVELDLDLITVAPDRADRRERDVGVVVNLDERCHSGSPSWGDRCRGSLVQHWLRYPPSQCWHHRPALSIERVGGIRRSPKLPPGGAVPPDAATSRYTHRHARAGDVDNLLAWPHPAASLNGHIDI